MNNKIIAIILIAAVVIASGYVYITYLSGPPTSQGIVIFKNLVVSPLKVVEGKSISITVNASNIEATSKTSIITLKVNNTVDTSKDVSFNPRESKIVSFTISKNKGYYIISIGNLTGSFSVISASEAVTLAIITRHDTTIWSVFEPVFLASNYAYQYNIMDLKWLSPDAGLWRDTIGATDVDVAWGGGPTLFDTLVSYNLLSPLENGTYAMQMTNEINDTIAGGSMKRFDNQQRVLWVAAAISSFGFTINNDVLTIDQLPTPNRWEDLANETYGKLLPIATISMGNAPGTTSNTRIYEIIIQAFGWNDGWRILTRMAGNAGIYGGSVETQSAVEQGSVAVGMSIDYYGFTSHVNFPSCQYILPQGETIINGDPIALVSRSKYKSAAQAFIGWVLSPEGQTLWLDKRVNRMPVRNVFRTEVGRQRSDLYNLFNSTILNVGIPFSDDVAISYEQSLMYYFEAVLKNQHDYLSGIQGAWTAIVKAKASQK
ncbi:MAG: transporter substrate-binding protein, partial [Thermoproteota archaeon]|nr:transporter substrate-binding protein [Thermoproteota archaeon]